MKSLRVSTGCCLSQMIAWLKYRPHVFQHRRIVADSWRSRPRCRSRGPAAARGPCCRTRRAAARRTPRRTQSRWPAAGPWPAASSASALTSRDAGRGRALGGASFPANELRPAAMALLLRGSTLTLYGGSVFTRWIVAPSEQPIHVFGLADCRRTAAGGRRGSTGRRAGSSLRRAARARRPDRRGLP